MGAVFYKIMEGQEAPTFTEGQTKLELNFRWRSNNALQNLVKWMLVAEPDARPKPKQILEALDKIESSY